MKEESKITKKNSTFNLCQLCNGEVRELVRTAHAIYSHFLLAGGFHPFRSIISSLGPKLFIFVHALTESHLPYPSDTKDFSRYFVNNVRIGMLETDKLYIM